MEMERGGQRKLKTFSLGEKCMEIKLVKKKIVVNGFLKSKIFRS